MGPADPNVVREECPDHDICAQTWEYLRDLQRKKVFLTQKDADEALDLEHRLLMKYKRPDGPSRTNFDVRGPAWSKYVMKMRVEAYQRLKKFASQVNWMPIPRM
jgi:hypothetical protein